MHSDGLGLGFASEQEDWQTFVALSVGGVAEKRLRLRLVMQSRNMRGLSYVVDPCNVGHIRPVNDTKYLLLQTYPTGPTTRVVQRCLPDLDSMISRRACQTRSQRQRTVRGIHHRTL